MSVLLFSPLLHLAYACGGTNGRVRATPRIGMCEMSTTQRWPLLSKIAAFGEWRGKMHYASGTDGLTPAPFVLSGTTTVSIDFAEEMCSLKSSVVLPNGAERVVELAGSLRDNPARLEGDGPIALLLSEHSEANTVLVREVNITSGASVLTSSLVMLSGGDGGTAELLQTAHELSQQPGGGVTGVQMWRMVPASVLAAGGRPNVEAGSMSWPLDDENDEEAFMYSGSEL